jgi:predicted nucleic-acid-binding Zn-ribbon protein
VGESGGYSWEEMFSSWVRGKQTGPLKCPVCAHDRFKPGGTVGAPRVDTVEDITVQFAYTYCGNCGYVMFFNAHAAEIPFIDHQ